MGSYKNAYARFSRSAERLMSIRRPMLQGTDTTGAFDNVDIMEKINEAQTFLYNALLNTRPQPFFTNRST